MSRTLGHIKALDGIRGLAIIAVLFCHFNNESLMVAKFGVAGAVFSKLSIAGANGVDLFFVLSGFLITGILVDTKNSNKYFTNFYSRRILRIFPLYYGTLILVLYVFPLFMTMDSGAVNILSKQFWLWTYTNNLPFINASWDGSNFFWLGHYWSLAVEEQFYLIWPLVIYSLSLGNVKKIVYFVLALSTSACLYSAVYPEKPMYLLLNWTTITRSGGLVLGALVALKVREDGWLPSAFENVKKYFAILSVLLIFIMFVPRKFLFADAISGLIHPVTWLLSSALILLVLVAKDTSPVHRLFSMPIMTNFGKYSYGIYVYHGLFRPLILKLVPLQYLVTLTGYPIIGTVFYFVITIGSSYLIAWLSWIFFEKRLLSLKKYFEYDQLPLRKKNSFEVAI